MQAYWSHGRLHTDDVIPESDGAERDEGIVEALAICPALHMTEEHWGENQEEHGAQNQERDHQQEVLSVLTEMRESLEWTP